MVATFSLKTSQLIDRFNRALIPWFALLLLPLILANATEVVMRYALNSPTVWAADVTVMSYGALFMLGAAYTLQKGAHVRTDMLWERFSDRTKGLIDATCYVLLFLPVMGLLFAISIDDLLYSYSIDERSTLSLWRPIIWPLRAVIPLSAVLLLLQGVSELIKSVWAAKTGQALEHHEKIEI